MTAGPTGSGFEKMYSPVLKSTGICLCLAGLLLMISGDSPVRMTGVSRWQTPVQFFAWSRLYLVLLLSGMVCFAAGGGAKSRNRCLDSLVKPVGLLLGAFFLSTLTSAVPTLSLRSYVVVLS